MKQQVFRARTTKPVFYLQIPEGFVVFKGDFAREKALAAEAILRFVSKEEASA